MTDAETALWGRLRRKALGVKFRRQHPFGPYILDFFAEEANLAVEVDGAQHYTESGITGDTERTRYLQAAGLHVLRFSDREVLLETESVLDAIYEAASGYES